jgi:hypothetical protein
LQSFGQGSRLVAPLGLPLVLHVDIGCR